MPYLIQDILVNGQIVRVYRDESTHEIITPITTPQEINGKQKIRVHRNPHNGEIIDIEVYISDKKRYEILRNVSNKHYTPAQSSLTYIFQNALADYQGKITVAQEEINETEEKTDDKRQAFMDELHGISSYFILLEKLINNPSSLIPTESLDNLLTQISEFEIKITSKITNLLSKTWSSDEAAQEEILASLTKFNVHIIKNIAAFKKQIEELRSSNPTHAEVKELFSLRSSEVEWALSPNQKSLGTFIADCMMETFSGGIDVAHAIKEATLDGRIRSHSWESQSVRALSSAKKNMREKMYSMMGTLKNTEYRIPTEMIDILTPEAPPTTDGSGWMSLKNYCRNWSILELDPVLCLALDKKSNDKEQAGAGIVAYTWAAMVPDLVYTAVRFVGQASLFVGYGLSYATESLLAYPLYYARNNAWFKGLYQECETHAGLSQWAHTAEQALSDGHRYLSEKPGGIFHAQKMWNDAYKRKNEDGTDDTEYQVFLQGTSKPINGFHLALEHLAPTKMVPYIAEQLSAIPQSLMRVGKELWYNPPTPVVWVLNKFKNKTKPVDLDDTEKRLDFLEKLYTGIKTKAAENPSEDTTISNPLTAENDESKDESPVTENSDNSLYPVGVPCQETNIANPFAVPLEVVDVLNKVIDHAFREAPLPSTAFCTFAALSFGTCVLPVAALGLSAKSVAAIQAPSQWLAHNFMGQGLSSMTAQMGSNFLLWKGGFFGTEGVKAVTEGEYDFLQRIFKNPEFFIMGSIACIAMGMAIGYMPEIPELPTAAGISPLGLGAYKSMMNGLIEESVYCTENGTPGLTSLEFGFLGLKFFMFMHSMISGNIDRGDAKKQEAIFLLLNEFIHSTVYKTSKDGSDFNTQCTVFLSEKLKDPIYAVLKADAENICKAFLDAYNTQPSAEIASHQTAEEKLRKEMKRLKECPEAFTAYGRSAQKNYDYMDNLIESVNQERRAAGKNDELIDKASFMREFRNQFYKGSSNAIRLLYLLPPVYLGVVLWRTYKSPPKFWNKLTGHTPSPDTVAQVRKSYAKDLANVLEMIGILGAGISFTLGRATQAVSRFIIGMVVYPLVSIVAAPFMGWNNALRWADNNLLRPIRLIDVNIPAWAGLLKLSKKAAVEASTSVNLSYAIDEVNKKLGEDSISNAEAPIERTDSQSSGDVKRKRNAITSGNLPLKNSQNETSKTYQPQTYWGKVHHFFGYNQLTSMHELSNKKLDKTQENILEKLASMKQQHVSEVNDFGKYAELIKELPEHWQDVVLKNYVPETLQAQVETAISTSIQGNMSLV